MQGKSIGVILPVYKNDKVEYLSKSVESVLYQTYQDIHLFIGIDGLIGDFLHYFCFCGICQPLNRTDRTSRTNGTCSPTATVRTYK